MVNDLIPQWLETLVIASPGGRKRIRVTKFDVYVSVEIE
jgi:hypothetical protein